MWTPSQAESWIPGYGIWFPGAPSYKSAFGPLPTFFYNQFLYLCRLTNPCATFTDFLDQRVLGLIHLAKGFWGFQSKLFSRQTKKKNLPHLGYQGTKCLHSGLKLCMESTSSFIVCLHETDFLVFADIKGVLYLPFSSTLILSSLDVASSFGLSSPSVFHHGIGHCACLAMLQGHRYCGIS